MRSVRPSRSVGLDRFHGDLAIMRAAFEQGFLPDYISTDLAATNLNSIVFDLPTTIAKVVACGMPLADAIARSTIGPATKLGRDAEIGDLREGSLADIAIFDVEEGAFALDDLFGNQVTAPRRLVNRLTLRKGETLQAPGRKTEVLDASPAAMAWRREAE